MLTLSLREPWLSQCLAIYDPKLVENRTWFRRVHDRAVLLHAAKQMEPEEYAAAVAEMAAFGVQATPLEQLRLGAGIVGVARVSSILAPHQEHLVDHLRLPLRVSRWWRRTEYGYVLVDTASFKSSIVVDGLPGFYETPLSVVQASLDAIGWRLTERDLELERQARPVQATLESLLAPHRR